MKGWRDWKLLWAGALGGISGFLLGQGEVAGFAFFLACGVAMLSWAGEQN